MPYKTLYHRRQSQPEYLPRQWYVDDAKELQWVEGIAMKASNRLLKERVRGLIIAHGANFIHGLHANYTIIVAEGMTPETERFVVIKELMHCYFGPQFGGATNSAFALENHLRDFFGNSFAIRSQATEAETQALWMALGVLCPESTRRRFCEAVAHEEMTFEQVAACLKVPVRTAKTLLSTQFEDEISHILR